MHPNSLLNLRPIRTSEEAREKGSKPKNPMQMALNGLKTGKYVTNPELKKAITLTPDEKIMGFTLSNKIQIAKSYKAGYGSTNPWAWIMNIQEDIFELEYLIAEKKKKGKPTMYDVARMTRLKMELHDRMHAKPDTLINVQQNQNQLNITGKMSLKELHEQMVMRGVNETKVKE